MHCCQLAAERGGECRDEAATLPSALGGLQAKVYRNVDSVLKAYA